MKFVGSYLFALFIFTFLLAPAFSAEQMEIRKAGAEVRTEYFTLKIPSGWIMPAPVKNQPNHGLSAVFALERGDLALTLNVVPAKINIPEYAEKMKQDMKKNGLHAGPLEKRNGFYRMIITGKIGGEAWFGESAGLFGAAILFGKDLRAANALFGALKPVKGNVFPRRID